MISKLVADEKVKAGRRLLTYVETSRILQVSDRTVRAMVAAGQIPAVRFGRSVRIDPCDLDRFIEQAKAG